MEEAHRVATRERLVEKEVLRATWTERFELQLLEVPAVCEEANIRPFVPVTTSASPIEIAIGRVLVRVPPGSDLSELRRVVEALS